MELKKLNPQLSPKAIREIREGTCNPLGAPQVTTDLSENIIFSLKSVVTWGAPRGLQVPSRISLIAFGDNCGFNFLTPF